MTLVYTPSVTTTTAGDIGMNIMVAIVFGGMPISGGARSKIYAAVVGGFSYIILNNILDLLIDSTSGYGITQIVSAVFSGSCLCCKCKLSFADVAAITEI